MKCFCCGNKIPKNKERKWRNFKLQRDEYYCGRCYNTAKRKSTQGFVFSQVLKKERVFILKDMVKHKEVNQNGN